MDTTRGSLFSVLGACLSALNKGLVVDFDLGHTLIAGLLVTDVCEGAGSGERRGWVVMHKSGHKGHEEGGLSMLMESQEHHEWGIR